MKIYCLEDFKYQFEKLIRNNSYKSLPSLLVDFFDVDDIEELKKGSLLNSDHITPYVKVRIGGRGGYRLYHLLVIKDNCVYLMYIHPKRGKLGSDNTTKEYRTELYKKVLEAIKNENFYRVNLDKQKKLISFLPIK